MRKILAVEDDKEINRLICDYLSDSGYATISAENGLDAVEIYSSNPGVVDMVLLDMIMPKAGGHETFHRIKEINPDAKILLSSGFVSEEEVQYLLKAGACGFLSKPHRLPVVIHAIRDVLDGKKVNSNG